MRAPDHPLRMMLPTRRARIVAAMTNPRPARYVTAAVLMASLTVAGCGENESPAVCSDVEALQASIADVTDLELDRGALATLRDHLTQMQSELRQLTEDARDEYASEIDAVDQAAASVSSSLEAATTSPSAQAVADVGVAVRAMGTSVSALVSAVRSTC